MTARQLGSHHHNMWLSVLMRRKRAVLCRTLATESDITSSATTYLDARNEFTKEIQALAEQTALANLQAFLTDMKTNHPKTAHEKLRPPPDQHYKHTMTKEQINLTLDAAMATFCLHVESRIAALMGKGFYTIGPCGEELLSAAALALHDHDDVALHYRHLGISMARQLQRGQELQQLLLDRARGYTVSSLDPVTGGAHCSIGSHRSIGRDYLVTSTLASQSPTAVGRALGYSLAAKQHKIISQPQQHDEGQDSQPKRQRRISMVTLGDGSVHNHHFLSAFHLARHAKHRSIQCPVLFGISDNGLSISYETQGYARTMFETDPLVPVYKSDGRDMMNVYSQTLEASHYVRRKAAPAVLLYQNLTRRFGHAATDRQLAYLSPEQIRAMAEIDMIERAMVQAIEQFQACTYGELYDRFEQIQQGTLESFVTASQEPKVTREDMMQRVSQPLVTVPRLPPALVVKGEGAANFDETTKSKKEVMRKHMTRVLEESLEQDPMLVYLGEDVEHGGYYLVTEGLVKKFPGRVMDFPPDETSLLGAAMGFSQLGLTPIIEIPYAKYLDCGLDMYCEIAVTNWLSAGQQSNGMVIRLQGFDRGLFGGNFHTHNCLPHIPPGVDVVCYSNGEDYVRGMRNAIEQARAGRVVVSVDCTNLLNLRHLHDKDRGWERPYPAQEDAGGTNLLGFDDVLRYGTSGKLAIVTYGNGVVTSLQARQTIYEKGLIKEEDVDIIDCPYLSGVPLGLRDALSQYEGVVFADICKQGPGSSVLSSTIVSLQEDGALPTNWTGIGAQRTYNPLGSMVTFLNVDDIAEACMQIWTRIA